MTEIFSAPWFWWAIVIAVALPVSLVVLTEVHNALLRRDSYLARPVSLVRNYVLPLGALLLLLLKATEVRADATTVRVVATVLGFVVLILLLSGLKAPGWHGRNLDALWDSITSDINGVSPPFLVEVTGHRQASEEVALLVSRVQSVFEEAREGRRVDVGFRLV